MPKIVQHTEAGETLEAWVAAYRAAAVECDRAAWGLADAVAIGRRKVAGANLGDAAAALGVSTTKLRQLYRVANAFPPDRRDPRLSYDLHRHLSGLPDEARFQALAVAASEGWTERQATAAAAAHRQDRDGFEDDREVALFVPIMRAWNRASPEARRYFAELQRGVGLGLVDEDAPCAA